jgi:hypothetical protein
LLCDKRLIFPYRHQTSFIQYFYCYSTSSNLLLVLTVPILKVREGSIRRARASPLADEARQMAIEGLDALFDRIFDYPSATITKESLKTLNIRIADLDPTSCNQQHEGPDNFFRPKGREWIPEVTSPEPSTQALLDGATSGWDNLQPLSLRTSSQMVIGAIGLLFAGVQRANRESLKRLAGWRQCSTVTPTIFSEDFDPVI